MGIRATNPNDFEAIQSLNRQLSEYEFEHSCSTMNAEYSYLDVGIEYLKSVVNQTSNNYGLVFENEKGVIGYASLYLVQESDLQHRTGIKQVQLKTLCVDIEHRGQNIGHQLLEASKDWAKKQGANNLRVVSMAQNDKARHFYKDCGFIEFEIIHEMPL